MHVITYKNIQYMVQGNRLRWFGHVLRKDDGDWVKMCYLEVEPVRQRDK